MWSRRRSKGNERRFTSEDRIAQLTEFESLCSRLTKTFEQNGDRLSAAAFDIKARHAARLIDEGFDQADLNELGGQLPFTMWLNPKAVDFGAPRLPWQDEVAELHSQAQGVAWNLRAVATLD